MFDARGVPLQRRGITPSAGLYFLGLHWMHKFKSGSFLAIGDDAAHLAEHSGADVRGSKQISLG